MTAPRARPKPTPKIRSNRPRPDPSVIFESSQLARPPSSMQPRKSATALMPARAVGLSMVSRGRRVAKRDVNASVTTTATNHVAKLTNSLKKPRTRPTSAETRMMIRTTRSMPDTEILPEARKRRILAARERRTVPPRRAVRHGYGMTIASRPSSAATCSRSRPAPVSSAIGPACTRYHVSPARSTSLTNEA